MNHNAYNFLLFFLIAMLSLFAIPFVSADKVGVIIAFPDGTTHGQCLDTNEGTNGFDLLDNELSLNTLWAGPGSFGHELCKVNNIGQEVTGNSCTFTGNKYWRFLKSENNKWEYMPVGFDGGNKCWNNDLSSFDGHYCAKEGDVVGLSFGEFADPLPSLHSFDQICNPIELSEVKVFVNGKKQSDADETGGEIEADPGSTITFKIELENNYLFDEDLELKDLEVKITAQSIDNGKDIRKEAKFKDLEFDENDEEEIEFTIPLSLDEDDYDIDLELNGRTSTNLKQETIIEYLLEIDREDHDLIFSKSELLKPETCPNQPNTLTLEIQNIGNIAEKNILLTVKNPELNLDFSETLNIDKTGDRSQYTRDISFTTPNLPTGDYNINLNLAYSETTKEDITLGVKDCGQQITGSSLQASQSTEPNIQTLGVKKATPSRQTVFQRSLLEIYIVPILLGAFLLFLITSLVLIVAILNN